MDNRPARYRQRQQLHSHRARRRRRLTTQDHKGANLAGQGALPKPPEQRVRRHKDRRPAVDLEFQPAQQPALPDETEWCPHTLEWWAMLGRLPQAGLFGEGDWATLQDCALLHNAIWRDGQLRYCAELRLRLQRFGIDPESRLRLRMNYRTPDTGDDDQADHPPQLRPDYDSVHLTADGPRQKSDDTAPGDGNTNGTTQ